MDVGLPAERPALLSLVAEIRRDQVRAGTGSHDRVEGPGWSVDRYHGANSESEYSKCTMIAIFFHIEIPQIL
jgi:hypothetical protein